MASFSGTTHEISGAETSASETAALSLIEISKQYPGVVALDRVDLGLHYGEIHAVVGENGAGKSTLIKVITGVIESDGGEIRANGIPVRIGTPRDATKLGITAVPQEVLLVPELPVGRNILLGMEGIFSRRTTLLPGEMITVQTALRQVGATFSPTAPTRSLSVPQLRLAQIARALVQPGNILVLDEPTAVLSEPDAEHLLDRLVSFRKDGKAIVYITHRLSEVMRIADRVTVLRDGRRVGHFPRGAFDRSRLLELMVKDEQRPTPSATITKKATDATAVEPALVVRRLSAGSRFSDVSFSARPGEIVGLAGVQGSGHGHVLRAIAGVDEPEAGEVLVFGARITLASPQAAFKRGLLFVPADRRGAGIVASRTVQENIALSPRIAADCRPYGMRSLRLEKQIAARQVDWLSISPRSPEALAGNLSGGNQQKVALARALSGNVQVLLAEEPTQGIDVHSRSEIHNLLRRIAREQGRAVVIASSEFDELIGLADLIHVMRLGQLVATLPGDRVRYHDLLHETLP